MRLPTLRPFLLLLLALPVLAAAQSAPAPAPNPFAPEWAQAGVSGGIPRDLPVIATLRPGDDVQAAIDAAPATAGVIELTAGDYPIGRTLRLRSGIALRGTDMVATRLLLTLRGPRPAATILADASAWPAGVLFQSTERTGLSQLTVIFDPALPPPATPASAEVHFTDDPGGRGDLHVVSVSMLSARDCWITNCLILNAGSHPLVISDSRQVTVNETEIEGAYNRGADSGRFNLIRSTHTLLRKVRVREINSVALHASGAGSPCRFNVLDACRFEVDLRLHGAGTMDNLLEYCVIAVPAWMDRPPLSPGNAKARELPPGPGNLLYLCTVTRDYAIGERAFSMADDPGTVYRVLETYARERAPSVSVFGPAPAQGSLRAAP